jgi:ribosome-associated translation inhibitor RaiA
MTYPVTINFLHMDRSEALETMLRERAEKLGQVHPAISSCHVVVEPEGRHQHQGRKYAVRLDIALKGRKVAINRTPHEDPFVAGRDAFDAARRTLEADIDVVRGRVKQHPVNRAPEG